MKLFVIRKSTSSVAALFLAGIFAFAFFSPSQAQTEIRNGLKFTGNNYVDCGAPPGNLFDFTDEGTIGAWVKVTITPPAANSTIFYPIVAKDEGPGENNKWIFGLQNGRLIFHENSPGENQDAHFSQFLTIYSQSFNLELNKYYYFAMTKDKGDMVTFYVNGINWGSSALMRKTTFVNAPLLIGKAEPGIVMKGEIYEVRFWKKALTADEIKQWMFPEVNASHAEHTGLAASFRLSEIKGTAVTGHNGISARVESGSVPLWNMPLLPGWLIILTVGALIVVLLCFILYRMYQKMQQEKMEMELFAAQMSHENNNGIGIMINILSSQLNKSGLGHLETQLKQRLQTIADLQSTEYIMCSEKGLAFKKCITHLVDKMNSAFNEGRQIVYEMDLPEKMKARHAMKLAVLIRELTLNSLKHAFRGKTTGEINISITPVSKGFFRFEFSDNGTGIIPGKAINISVGTAIINSISSQLGGKPDVVSDNGYKFVLLFK